MATVELALAWPERMYICAFHGISPELSGPSFLALASWQVFVISSCWSTIVTVARLSIVAAAAAAAKIACNFSRAHLLQSK